MWEDTPWYLVLLGKPVLRRRLDDGNWEYATKYKFVVKYW